MAFDPPGPRNNPPIRDFLYRQEVVLAPEVSRVRLDPSSRASAAHLAEVDVLRRADGQQGRHQDQEEPHD